MFAAPSLVTTEFTCNLRVACASERERHVVQLGDAIATLAARLHAATYELLVMLREFDACGGWNNGCLSCAHWLHWRTGIDLGAAREKVRVARALPTLPCISAAIKRGQLSYAKVRALTRIATPGNEARLVDLALAGTAAQVERLVRAWRRVDQIEAARQTEHRHLHRSLTMHVDDDGMVVLRGRLTPEIGAIVQRALEAAADRLFQEAAHVPTGNRIADEVTPAQRRADALGLLAECALSTDLDRGTAGDRYQVVLHVDAAALQTTSESAAAAALDLPESYPWTTADVGQAVVELNDGAIHVSAETSRRIACDASLVAMHHARDGTVLDVGRKTRTIPPAIRRALLARDRRCQFPGCTARRCDGHHIRHWADGGSTRLDNLTLLCRRHHRAVHEGAFTIVQQDEGTPVFYRPDDTCIEIAPAVHRPDHDVDPWGPTAAQLTAPDVPFDPYTTMPRGDAAPFDVAWAIDVLHDSAATNPAARAACDREGTREPIDESTVADTSRVGVAALRSPCGGRADSIA